jgi:hypothetical protein
VHDRAPLAANDRRTSVRTGVTAGLIGAVYSICGGVVWSAYEEFGSQSLLDLAPLVVADPTPLKLLPDESTEGRTALPAASDRSSASALAHGDRGAPSFNRPAPPMAPSLATAQDSEVDAVVLTRRPALARHGTEPVPATGVPGSEASIVAALGTPALDIGPAAPLGSATPAVSDEVPRVRPVATLPPAPAFKPLDAVPTVVAQATLAPPVRSQTGTPGLGEGPPTPSFKPIAMPSERRPGLAEQDTRRVAATGPTLPDAFRTFWTNLKILLASGPAPRVLPAAGGNNSGRDSRPVGRSDVGHASGNGGEGTSAGAGTSGGSGSSGSGGSSADGGGGSSSTNSGGGKGGDGKGGSGGKGGKGGGGGKSGKDGGGGKGSGGGKGGRGDDRGGDDDDGGGDDDD